MTRSSGRARYLVGVDLAGPRFTAGAFTSSFQLVGKAHFSPKPERGAQSVVDRLARCICDAVDEADLALGQVQAVGLAVPGRVEAAAGRVLAAPTLGWTNFDLREQLQQRLRLPVALENDCAAAAVALYRLECPGHAGRLAVALPDRAGLLGLVVDGTVAPIPASVPQLHERLGLGLLPLTQPPKPLRKAVQAGDPRAQETVADLARQLASWLGAIIPVLKPDLVVLSGGLVEELHSLVWPSLQAAVAHCFGSRSVTLKLSSLGKDVAMLGGAVLAAGA